MAIEHGMRVMTEEGEGVVVRKGKTTSDSRGGRAFWVDVSGKIAVYFEGELQQLDKDPPKKPRKLKQPPQKEVLFPDEEYLNHIAMTEESRETFHV